MLSIDVSADFKQVERMLRGMPGVVDKAAAAALNDAAWSGKKAIEQEMAKVFDRPTSYTLNSLRVQKARSNRLVAKVWVKNKLDAGKGTSPEDYLLPQVYGGKRSLKRFEKALQRKGILPVGMYAVPGEGAKLDSYGNMSRGQIVQIMSYFQSFGEQGYKANMNDKSRSRLARGSKNKRGFAYFVSPGWHLPRGIWQRVYTAFGTAVKPVLMFVRAPSYGKRLRFNEIAKATADKEFRVRFNAEVQKRINAQRVGAGA